MTDQDVEIGYVEEKESWLLHPRFFPSKVGGKPAWLHPNNIISPSELSCKHCSEVMVFLCQIYAPFDDKEYTFHRTLFVFVCKNGSCCKQNNSDNLKVFRSQLARDNEFYSFEPYEENKDEIFSMDKWPKLCHVCGIKAPSHCSKCKKVYYCCRSHQILHWQKGHKESCNTLNEVDESFFTVTESGKSLLFKEWEFMVSDEDKEEVNTVDTKQEMEKLRKLVEERKAGTMNEINDSELAEYAGQVPEDKVFNKFSKRIARHPDQVLRYKNGGTPLWITSPINNLIQIPNCKYCNGERQFEFQIMPQLLNFIAGVQLNSIDWGVLVFYTCKESCNKGPAYKEEVIIKQDLTM